MRQTARQKKPTFITLTGEIVSAHVSYNSVTVEDVGPFIQEVYRTLRQLGVKPEPEPDVLQSAVSVRASVRKDRLICLDCGKSLKTLRRHLAKEHSMSPQEYRKRWNLPANYPFVAADYAALRAEMAKAIGLGRKPKTNARGSMQPKSSTGGRKDARTTLKLRHER